MIKRTYIVVMACLLIAISSCKKEDTSISDTPQIEFKSVSPASFTEFSQELTFVIGYTDGDGDLGENNPDVKNLFLTDSRNGVTYKYRIQQLAPDGANVAIKGDLSVVLNGTGITDGSNSQTFTYSIEVVDRAGNVSNSVTSSPITVTK